jgi:hypothetical protein
VQDGLPKLKGQRLILFIDQDSFKVIKETGYKNFKGPTQGTVKVLGDPEAGSICEEGHNETSIFRICHQGGADYYVHPEIKITERGSAIGTVGDVPKLSNLLQ